MKILQAFDFLSLPHGGGTVDIVYKLSKTLAKRGHDITICTGDYELDTDYLRGLGNVGLKVHHSYFNKHGIYLMPSLLGLYVRDYDLIHFHCYRSIQNVILAQKAVTHGIPYIIDAHGSTVPRTGSKKLLLDMFDLMLGLSLIERAKFVIAETEIGIAEWEKLGTNRDKIRLQHPLLDTSEFAILPEYGIFRRKYRIGNRLMVLFLGRLHKSKGIDLLIDAFKYISHRGKLVIAGSDDGFRETLQEQVDREQLSDTVLFTGFLGGMDKLSAIVDADVLVQPSKNEAGARPSLEAIMCKTPVIVSRDTGAGREIAGFDGGDTFDHNVASDLIAALYRVSDNPDKAKARTEKAREYIIENLSLDNGIAGYEKLYQEAVE